MVFLHHCLRSIVMNPKMPQNDVRALKGKQKISSTERELNA